MVTACLTIAGAALLTIPERGVSHLQRRVEGEILALSAAISNYRDVHGDYPSKGGVTDSLKPNVTYDSEAYIPASAFLYRELSGDSDGDPKTPPHGQVFYEFKRDNLRLSQAGRSPHVVDPWGNSYGYSTFKSKHPDSADGNNASFDLWSTNGKKNNRDISKWVKNW